VVDISTLTLGAEATPRHQGHSIDRSPTQGKKLIVIKGMADPVVREKYAEQDVRLGTSTKR
jgi:hypothetical protein